MALIYEPKGKAREYSPLALNIYSGCDHLCKYCYNRLYHGGRVAVPRKNILALLEKELESKTITSQVLLSFIGDIYCKTADPELTRGVLILLKRYNVPTAILSKGGRRSLGDKDLLVNMNCKLGATLTFWDEGKSLEWEPGAATPEQRIDAIAEAHENGVRTWASFEPVIEPSETLEVMARALPYLCELKIGKINHNKALEEAVNWPEFLAAALELCRGRGKRVYIKEDLRNAAPGIYLTPDEVNPGAVTLRATGAE